MPLYEFRDESTGASVDLHLPADSLPDEIVLKRVRIPRTIHALARSGQTVEQAGHQKLAGALRKFEARGELRQTKPGHLSMKDYQRAMALPAT